MVPNPPDIELCKEVRENNSNDALQELIKRHSPLCFSLYQKYRPYICGSGAFFDDVCRDKDTVIWQAACSYNGTTQFNTWLGNNIRYQCLSIIKKEGQHTIAKENFTDFYPVTDPEVEKRERVESVQYILNVLNGINDPRVRDVFELRYLSGRDLSWLAIGEEIGVSIQTAINLHEKGKKFLEDKIKCGELLDFV